MITKHSETHAHTDDDRILIDYGCALELLEKLVAERGENYVYEAPEYSPDGACAYAGEDADGTLTPSCGVGWVVYTIRPDLLSVLHELDPGYGGRFTGASASSVLRDYLPYRGVIFDADAIKLLQAFQYNQDRDVMYGAALRQAKINHLVGVDFGVS